MSALLTFSVGILSSVTNNVDLYSKLHCIYYLGGG